MSTLIGDVAGAGAEAGTPSRAGLRHLLRRNVFLPLGGLIVAVFLVCAIAPGLIVHGNPIAIDVANQFVPPGGDHLLGTDQVGRDVLTRIVHGTRYSIGIAIAVVVIGAVFGSIYGSIAGLVGGLVDEVAMRIVDVFFSLPAFILAMAIAAVMGRGLVSLLVALTIVWWPGYARFTRGMVLSIKERTHITSARALGAGWLYILRRHIWPFMLAELNVRVTQDIGYALVAVASLSFIGLGVQPPTPEWGLLLADARSHITGSWWNPVFPGLAITIATVGFTMLGDALSDLMGLEGDHER
jgi:peptide/nickel transport system permease protein